VDITHINIGMTSQRKMNTDDRVIDDRTTRNLHTKIINYIHLLSLGHGVSTHNSVGLYLDITCIHVRCARN
jgi:hypothetical protein